MKTFQYKDYKECYFIVSSYNQPEKPIAIQICNNIDGPISTCTIYKNDFSVEGLATIKNYSENSKMTAFLKKLGVVEEICYRMPCNSYPEVLKSLNTRNPQTIDYCKINLKKLKEYSKEWYYD